MQDLRTLKDIDVHGKRVLLRVDFNVPHSKETRKVADNTRIRSALPTIQYLLDHQAKLIIISHLGRPKGKIQADLRLSAVKEELSALLGQTVKKLDDCIGEKVEKAVGKMSSGDIILLENIRFYPEEEANHPEFVRALAKLGDVFVSDAFGAIHREHASTTGLANFLPAYAGLLLEKEMKALYPLLETPDSPFLLVIGGAKIDTKIGILKSFLHKVDAFLIGGGLANTFLRAQGYDTGYSLCEDDKLELAREIMLEANKSGEKLLLPEDVLVAPNIEENVTALNIPVDDVEGHMKILDIGEKTIRRYCQLIEKAGTVVWNGPLGLYEHKTFQKGTLAIAKAMRECKGVTIVGGGDTLDALKRFEIFDTCFTHVSTGGGAMLEFLEGKVLPGIEVLRKVGSL